MKVAIIGGAGKMGKWFCNFFLNEGYEVIVSGRKETKLNKLVKQFNVKSAKNNIEAIKNADLIMIAVLFQDFESVVKEIAPAINNTQKVVDITSIKDQPVKIMHKYIKRGITLGAHPMFGPNVKDNNHNFVLTPVTKKERAYAQEFSNWLTKKGFNVSIMPPRRHDELMSTILGLPHFIGLVTADTLTNLNLKELKKVCGTSFNMLLELTTNVISNDPEFYSHLQMILPKINKVESLFSDKTKKWLTIVNKEDKSQFKREMIKIAQKSKYLLVSKDENI